MTSPADDLQRAARRCGIGIGLFLIGLLALALWRVVSGTENLAFADGAATPPAAAVKEGDTYSLAAPGGADALIAHGVVAPNGLLALSCDWTIGNAPEQGLEVSAERADTRAETTVGRFVAPVTGSIRVTCANWGPMFVSDADDVGADTSGWFLLAAILLFGVGGVLGLSGGRDLVTRRSRAARDDDEIERYVDAEFFGGYDREVRRDDGGDFAP